MVVLETEETDSMQCPACGSIGTCTGSDEEYAYYRCVRCNHPYKVKK